MNTNTPRLPVDWRILPEDETPQDGPEGENPPDDPTDDPPEGEDEGDGGKGGNEPGEADGDDSEPGEAEDGEDGESGEGDGESEDAPEGESEGEGEGEGEDGEAEDGDADGDGDAPEGDSESESDGGKDGENAEDKQPEFNIEDILEALDIEDVPADPQEGTKASAGGGGKSHDIMSVASDDVEINTMAARLFGMIAEDAAGADTEGDDYWDMKKLMRRRYDGVTPYSCRKTRTRESIVLLLDNSGSCRDMAGFFSAVANAATQMGDVDMYYAFNGKPTSKYSRALGHFEAIDSDEYLDPKGVWTKFKNRVVIYFSDYDGRGEIVASAKHLKAFYWFNCATHASTIVDATYAEYYTTYYKDPYYARSYADSDARSVFRINDTYTLYEGRPIESRQRDFDAIMDKQPMAIHVDPSRNLIRNLPKCVMMGVHNRETLRAAIRSIRVIA